jgi:glycosyltransferase involved in cell wall biosynthesis
MTRVALYASQLAPGGPTGIHRYVTEITRALFALHPDRYRLLASAETAEPIWLPRDIPIRRLPGPRRALHLAWYLARYPKIERFSPDADLVHVLSPTFPVPSRKPIVYTLHDLQHLEDAGAFRRRESRLGIAALKEAAKRAAMIIAVSGAVADAAEDRLGVERTRITVIHHGVSDRFRVTIPPSTLAEVCTRFGVERGAYFVYVGKVELRKNVTTLVRAAALKPHTLRLLIVGPRGFGAEEVAAEIERRGVGADVTLTGHVSDNDLIALMAGARALVHPSGFEGFGFTPLEAMALGTPAIASRAGSLPEVLGDGALLLDGLDAEAWSTAMTRLQQDPAFADSLGERGRRHAGMFTWERAARETAAVHERALRT